MKERTATILHRDGLHARPAAAFAGAAGRTGLKVTIAKEGAAPDDAVDATSILSLMGLHARWGDKVVLRAEGPGADEALENLVALLETERSAT